jgi:lipopolysaccharide export system permease protein
LGKLLSKLLGRFRISLIHRYILERYLSVLAISLFASVTLFIVFEMLDRMSVFIREGASLWLILQYIIFKIPLIVQLMLPVSAMVATLISIGRLSQLSEITAMRAGGLSVQYLVRPLLIVGVILSGFGYLLTETIVPATTKKFDEVYHLDIRRKVEKGSFSRSNFWYREGNKFINVGHYDSKNSKLQDVSIYEVDPDFTIRKRVDAKEANFGRSSLIGWTLYNATETELTAKNRFSSSRFRQIPMVTKKEPQDFYNMEVNTDALSSSALRRHAENLAAEGVPVTKLMVDLAAKKAFPLVCLIVIMTAFPFALIPARSGNLSVAFLAGISLGFLYYVVHAFSLSLGNGELIPVTAAAWSANILLGCVGGYLLAGADYR